MKINTYEIFTTSYSVIVQASTKAFALMAFENNNPGIRVLRIRVADTVVKQS